MRIEINNSKTINVIEKNLIVKNNKLYNVVTNEYEAPDGDRIQFCTVLANGKKAWIGGTVDGYTCNRRIKLKGDGSLYASLQSTGKVVERHSTITDTDYVEEETLEVQKKNEWETILSA